MPKMVPLNLGAITSEDSIPIPKCPGFLCGIPVLTKLAGPSLAQGPYDSIQMIWVITETRQGRPR